MQNTSISPNISMAAFQENKVGIWSSFGGTDTFRKCKSEKGVFKNPSIAAVGPKCNFMSKGPLF